MLKMCCPKCGSKLVKRKGKYGEFLGYLIFPNCKYTQSVKNIDKLKKLRYYIDI